MDKWTINRIVPSEAGIFEIWIKDGKNIVPLTTRITYYGGIRHSLRDIIDEMVYNKGKQLRELINGRESWFRYSTSPIRNQLELLKTWFEHRAELFDEDGNEVLVEQIDSNAKFPPPPQDIKNINEKRLADKEYGPYLPEV